MSRVEQALNRLGKWRLVLAGWQLGTRPDTDPEAAAVRDHREATLMHRAELNALTAVLVQKGLLTTEELTAALAVEADQLERDLQRRYPGFKATDEGIVIDQRAATTTRGWRP